MTVAIEPPAARRATRQAGYLPCRYPLLKPPSPRAFQPACPSVEHAIDEQLAALARKRPMDVHYQSGAAIMCSVPAKFPQSGSGQPADELRLGPLPANAVLQPRRSRPGPTSAAMATRVVRAEQNYLFSPQQENGTDAYRNLSSADGSFRTPSNAPLDIELACSSRPIKSDSECAGLPGSAAGTAARNRRGTEEHVGEAVPMWRSRP